MDEVQFLESRFGSRWCGIKFEWKETVQEGNGYSPLPFCTAVAQPEAWPIVLTPELMDCPGGRYSLGWYSEKNHFLLRFAEKSGLQIEHAENILEQNEKLGREAKQVIVGTSDKPDVFLSFAQPELIMQIIHKWQNMYGYHISFKTSGYMSICSSVSVRAFQTDQICISFGCPTSRERTGIGRDRLAIGLSCNIVEYFQQAETAHSRYKIVQS